MAGVTWCREAVVSRTAPSAVPRAASAHPRDTSQDALQGALQDVSQESSEAIHPVFARESIPEVS